MTTVTAIKTPITKRAIPTPIIRMTTTKAITMSINKMATIRKTELMVIMMSREPFSHLSCVRSIV